MLQDKEETTNEVVQEVPKTKDPNSWMYDGISNAVSEETARKDILSWMNHKQFSFRKRKSLSEWINKLVEAVQDGDLVVIDGKKLVQKIRGSHDFTELKYSERLVVKSYNDAFEKYNANPQNGTDRIDVCVALMTGITYAQACKIEDEDRELMSAIALFFM